MLIFAAIKAGIAVTCFLGIPVGTALGATKLAEMYNDFKRDQRERRRYGG